MPLPLKYYKRYNMKKNVIKKYRFSGKYKTNRNDFFFNIDATVLVGRELKCVREALYYTALRKVCRHIILLRRRNVLKYSVKCNKVNECITDWSAIVKDTLYDYDDMYH